MKAQLSSICGLSIILLAWLVILAAVTSTSTTDILTANSTTSSNTNSTSSSGIFTDDTLPRKQINLPIEMLLEVQKRMDALSPIKGRYTFRLTHPVFAHENRALIYTSNNFSIFHNAIKHGDVEMMDRVYHYFDANNPSKIRLRMYAHADDRRRIQLEMLQSRNFMALLLKVVVRSNCSNSELILTRLIRWIHDHLGEQGVHLALETVVNYFV